MDRTVLTGSCGPTLVLTVHGINKKSSSLGLKNRFLSRFPVFTIRPLGQVWFWKPCYTIRGKLIFTLHPSKKKKPQYLDKFHTNPLFFQKRTLSFSFSRNILASIVVNEWSHWNSSLKHNRNYIVGLKKVIL